LLAFNSTIIPLYIKSNNRAPWSNIKFSIVNPLTMGTPVIWIRISIANPLQACAMHVMQGMSTRYVVTSIKKLEIHPTTRLFSKFSRQESFRLSRPVRRIGHLFLSLLGSRHNNFPEVPGRW
jgi:hypothetical protein